MRDDENIWEWMKKTTREMVDTVTGFTVSVLNVMLLGWSIQNISNDLEVLHAATQGTNKKSVGKNEMVQMFGYRIS
jgi:hypothetical protein